MRSFSAVVHCAHKLLSIHWLLHAQPANGRGIVSWLFTSVALITVGILMPETRAQAADAPKFFFVSEYRVHGVHSITSLEVEKAVYPFLGPDRTVDDIHSACSALEKAYQAKGFGAASVWALGRPDKNGLVALQVSEGAIERLRVTGARYFSPEKIKRAAPALAEGRVINFNDVSRDVVGLNQLGDRTVTPTLRPGSEPGTYDIDLQVKDSSPFHASVELNNDNSPNTRPLRLTGSVDDSNLWQSGQGAGVSFEKAPQRHRDSEVFSGYYLARFAGVDGLTLMVQGTKQDSNISTLGGSTVAGPGQTLMLRANYTIPNGEDWDTGKAWENFTESINLSLNYKHYNQSINTLPVASSSSSSTATTATPSTIVTPITYYPLTAGYSALWTGWAGTGSVTALNLGVTLNLRGAGSGPNQFNLNRYGADGSFVYLRGDLARTQDLPGGWQAYAKIQGQVANQPLVSSEEYSGGGESTVRGYLESETVGDDGAFGTVELRTPSLFVRGKQRSDFRFFAFSDAGKLKLIDPLAEQVAHFSLASVGAGVRLALNNYFSGACDVADPLTSQTYTQAHDLRFRFRVLLDY
jgi:hemolysin activation/secretion protein